MPFTLQTFGVFIAVGILGEKEERLPFWYTFMYVYAKANGAVGIGAVLGWCVIPFIIPDLVKIALAFVLSGKLRRYVPQ